MQQEVSGGSSRPLLKFLVIRHTFSARDESEAGRLQVRGHRNGTHLWLCVTSPRLHSELQRRSPHITFFPSLLILYVALLRQLAVGSRSVHPQRQTFLALEGEGSGRVEEEVHVGEAGGSSNDL